MTAAAPEAGERSLRRVLTTRDLAVCYVSSLVGAGVLVVPGIAVSTAGPASLVAWLVLSVASLPIAVTFARFSARHPSAGGVSHQDAVRRRAARGDRIPAGRRPAVGVRGGRVRSHRRVRTAAPPAGPAVRRVRGGNLVRRGRTLVGVTPRTS